MSGSFAILLKPWVSAQGLIQLAATR